MKKTSYFLYCSTFSVYYCCYSSTNYLSLADQLSADSSAKMNATIPILFQAMKENRLNLSRAILACTVELALHYRPFSKIKFN